MYMHIVQKLNNNQRRIGLTGGIATGKSTISKYIRENKRIPTIDADNLSRELIEPNTIGYKKILEYFGKRIIDQKDCEKTINRKLLRKIIFENEQHREWINQLLHPLIKEKMVEKCYEFKDSKIILLVIPLLFEAKFEDICTEIWLIDCPKKVQVKRLIKRDKIGEEEAYRIINLQMTFEEKVNFSDIILNNSDNTNQWEQRIKHLI